jgi:L-threonylcarbamoyladenylate synthase
MFASYKLKKLVTALQKGELIAFPTETVYALAADARNSRAVKKIFALKSRPYHQPLSVLLHQNYVLEAWARNISSYARRLADNFWPGPLTLIFNKHETVLSEITGGGSKIGLRVPDHPIAQSILAAIDTGLAAPSANRTLHLSPTCAEHVYQEFGPHLPLIDGGPCTIGIESTIVDVTSNIPKIVRLGAISQQELQKVVRCKLEKSTSERRSKIRWVATKNLEKIISTSLIQNKVIAVLARFPAILSHKNLVWMQMPRHANDYARILYAVLHEAIKNAPDEIIVQPLPRHYAWSGLHMILKNL